MSETTYQIRGQRLGTAVAVIAGGLFSAAVPAAQAHPVFALAPPCEAYKFVGVQDWIAGSFTFVIPTQGDRAVGDADAVGKDNGQDNPSLFSHGHSSGGVTGKDIDVTIYFDDGVFNGKTARFTGQVHDDGSASGDLIDLTTNKTEPWASQFSDRIDCEKRAQQTSPMVTVLAKSDVFDAPSGNRIGPDSYYLKVGRQLQLVQPCKDDWCLLAIPDPEVPTGQGWVFAGRTTGQDFLDIPN